MASKAEAQSLVAIDRDHLDRECIQLPTTYMQFAFKAGEAKRDVDEAKATLEALAADLGLRVRTNPKKFGIDKTTVDIINAIVLNDADYKEAQAELIKAKHRHEMTQAVVWALEHKKRSLTLLVDLHGMGYFSDVKATEAGRDAVKRQRRSKSVVKSTE